MTQDELDAAIDVRAGKAQRTVIDGQEIERDKLTDLIALSKYRAGQRSAAAANGGMRFLRVLGANGGGR